jgi:hypothetical protein
MDALGALKAGLLEHSESCGEKAILIRMCSELLSEGRGELLEDLARTAVTPEQRKNEKKCSEAYERVTNLADSQERVSVRSDSGPDTISASDGYKSGDSPSFRRNITGTQGAFYQTRRTHNYAPKSYNQTDKQFFRRSVFPTLSVDVPSVNGNIDIKRTEREEEKLDTAYKNDAMLTPLFVKAECLQCCGMKMQAQMSGLVMMCSL